MSCARARRTACGAGTQTRLDARASLSYARMAVSYPKTPIPPAKADLPARVLHEAPRDRSCATAFRAMSERVRAHAEARAGRGRENGKGLALERSAKRRCLQEALQGFLRAPLPLAFFSVSLTCFGCVPGGGLSLDAPSVHVASLGGFPLAQTSFLPKRSATGCLSARRAASFLRQGRTLRLATLTVAARRFRLSGRRPCGRKDRGGIGRTKPLGSPCQVRHCGKAAPLQPMASRRSSACGRGRERAWLRHRHTLCGRGRRRLSESGWAAVETGSLRPFASDFSANR